MATTAFICDVEDSEKFVGSQQLKQRVCSYTLLQVLVGTLVVFVLAMTGGIIWMKLSQNCSERVWKVRFNGTDTDFISPESEEYEIFGVVFTETPSTDACPKKTFRLLQKPHHPKQIDDGEIVRQNLTEVFVTCANLKKGTALRVELNCNSLKIDEAKSILVVYKKSSCWPR